MSEAPDDLRPNRSDDDRMRATYVQVLLTWVVVLLALFAFQEYFS